jgi:putative transposase
VTRSFKYRLYPTAEQERVLSGTLDGLRSLYNAGLQQRREAYSRQGKSLSRYDQHKDLTGIKKICPELAMIPAQVLRDPLNKLDLAFRCFFQRVKAGQAPGFPRFKGRGQFRSFAYPTVNNGAHVLDDGHSLRLFGIGVVQVKRHRPYRGTIKQVRITFGQDERWHVLFVCEDVPVQALSENNQDVGIDLGLTTFATLSDGTEVANPRYMRKAERKIKFHQRRLARAQLKSNRRKKIRRDLARAHVKVRRTRRDFHFKTANMIVKRFGAIYHEDLNVVGMISKNRSGMRRSISDAGWGQFIAILTDKAESAGRVIVAVNPAGTSQLCSACGLKVPKSLSDREHICPCGFRAGRDLNAALNVKLLGRSGQTSLHEHWRARSENLPETPPIS